MNTNLEGYLSLNTNQRLVFDAAMEWWKGDRSEPFEISGPPGSGKTYLINTIIDYLGISRERVAPFAYTGAAAINMRIHGMANAKTCHSWLYMPVMVPILDSNGNYVIDPVFNKPKMRIGYVERDKIEGIELFIIDEGSTVPPEMRKTIEKHHIPTIVAGDLDQLPPITGTPAYFNNPYKVHILTEIMRQNMNSGIVQLCQRAKNRDMIHPGYYGDVLVIYEDQLTNEMLANADMLICSRNSTRDYYNQYIRKNIYRRESTLPVYGDRLVCRKNNWNVSTPSGINLTNGLVGTVINYPEHTYDRNTGTFVIDFKPDLDICYFDSLDCNYKYFISDSKERKKLKNNSYLLGERFEFGYCITTHMSQGSEYNKGIYIEEELYPNVKDDNINLNNKLNYVGLSRFRQFCIYVKKRY